MKIKQTIFCLAIAAFSLSNSSAQNIQNIYSIPSNPGPLDSVSMVIDLVFNSGSCELQNESHSISGDSIFINVTHCPGPLTVICYTSDTIQLGLLNAGSYHSKIVVHTGDLFTSPPCSSTIAVDSGTYELVISPGTGIQEKENHPAKVYYDSGTKSILLDGRYRPGTLILLFNTNGEMVIRKTFDESRTIILPNLSAGVYLYEIRNPDGGSGWGKFRVD